MVAVEVVIIAAVALLGVLVVGLLRSNAELTRAVHRLGIDLGPGGTGPEGALPVALSASPVVGARPTPGRADPTRLIDLAGVSPTGDAVSLAVTGVRHDTVVAFLTSGCQTCRGFWEALRVGTPDVAGGARLVVVTRGPEAESPGTIAGLCGTKVPVVMSSEVWTGYDVPYAPYFVYVSASAGRVVGEGVAATWEAVSALVAAAVADGTTSSAAADANREARVDRELAAAGILPGDDRLGPSASGRR